MVSQEQLIAVINTVGNLIRSIHLKRALSAINPDPALNFWLLIHGNLLDVAVLEWCKLFGSDDKDHQPTHWKNVAADQDAFRSGLLKHLNIDKETWEAYWTELKTYRDTRVAHLDFNKLDITHYPKLDLALESAYFYYAHALAELRKQGVRRYPDDIREYCDRFAKQAAEIGDKALAATDEMKERVY